jgi:hypothetical protein
MKKKLAGLLVITAVTCNSPVQSAETDPKNQDVLLNKIQKLEQQIAELTALQRKKLTLPVKREQCMKVVGVESYCACVVERLPASVDYRQFVHILLTPSKELGYDMMTAEQKNEIDLAVVVWATCVDYKGPKGAGFIDGLMKRDTLF